MLTDLLAGPCAAADGNELIADSGRNVDIKQYRRYCPTEAKNNRFRLNSLDRNSCLLPVVAAPTSSLISMNLQDTLSLPLHHLCGPVTYPDRHSDHCRPECHLVYEPALLC